MTERPLILISNDDGFQAKGINSLVDAIAHRSYKFYLIFAEVSCDMLVIAKRVRSLREFVLIVNAQCFAFNAEFAGIKVFACGHIFTSNSSVLLNVVYHGDTVIYSVKHSSGRICMSL